MSTSAINPAVPVAAAQNHTGADTHEANPSPQPAPRLLHLQAGIQRVGIVLQARELKASGLSWPAVGAHLGLPWNTVYGWCQKVRDQALPTAEALADGYAKCGRKPKYERSARDLKALRQGYLTTNRTEDCGSAEEAARMALRRGELSPGLTAMLRQREAAGQDLLPESLRRQVLSAPVVVRQSRSPKNVDLDYFSAPGTMMWVADELTGHQEQFIRAGDILEADDATVNFPVCVPWEVGGDKCSDRWGVKVARFQWLVAIDAATRFVPGFSYTARPKSSYRGEDVLSLLHSLFATHGVWRRARFERGVFESHAVTGALKAAGVKLKTVWSPHQKPFIEGLFNFMWTKLSDMPGQVGRFRGEMEEENKVLTSCQAGATDPRTVFPMLGDAINAFLRVLTERNQQRVRSTNYGTWIPEERWLVQRDEGRLRPLDASSAWMFAPCVRQWTVQGGNVGGTVPIAEGWSIRYDFAASWLPEYDGAKVQCFFDPAAPENQCEAVVVLTDNLRDVRAGTVLGRAIQVNKVARYARRVMGWGEDLDQGLGERKTAASHVRREVRVLLPGGRQGPALTEARTADASVRIERISGEAGPATAATPRRQTAPIERFDAGELLGAEEETPLGQSRGYHETLERMDAAALL